MTQGSTSISGLSHPGPNYNHEIAQRIENDFRYHTPKDDQPERYNAIREKAKELAHLINNSVPNGREKSTSLTQLEMCVMQANAGIARNE